MYAVYKSVTGFVTALAICLALTFGCSGTSQSSDFGNELFQGIERELAEIGNESIRGNAYNKSVFPIHFAVYELVDPDREPIFQADIAPGERVIFYLEPGEYVVAAVALHNDTIIRALMQRVTIHKHGGEIRFKFTFTDNMLDA